MRLYLEAESKNKIGYVPDWLRITYSLGDKTFDLTLDVMGDINYNLNTLSCRCKGDLVPWVHRCCDIDEEINLDDMTREQIDILYPPYMIADYIDKAIEFAIGIYPVDDSDSRAELIESDVVSNGEALLIMYIDEGNQFEKHFEFTTELNV